MLSYVQLFETPHGLQHETQASLSITNSRSFLKFMSIESVMPSNHLILCRALLLLPSVFPSIRVFSNESVLLIRWPSFETVHCSMSDSNCCFLTCTQVSQQAGMVVWHSHLLKNFPQFVVIHTVKDLSVVNEAEVVDFLELSCFFYDPMMLAI